VRKIEMDKIPCIYLIDLFFFFRAAVDDFFPRISGSWLTVIEYALYTFGKTNQRLARG